MRTVDESARIAAGLLSGGCSEEDLSGLDTSRIAEIIAILLKDERGRRWVRASAFLDESIADRLLTFPGDFNQRRHDATLARVVRLASLEGLQAHCVAIAAGSGAPELWSRLATSPAQLQRAVDAIVADGDARALKATATHLLLDPTANLEFTSEHRRTIATEIIASRTDAARAVAAEYLAGAAPDALAERIDTLARDAAPSVRGFAWFAAFQVDRAAATSQALEILGDEGVAVELRRSALGAAGESLPTAELVALLSYFVVHPELALALDAAELLQRHHRHPEIAVAAAGSPHDEVRGIAIRLLDPYRGSPAAGGSRPGDPLRSDPLLELMRRLDAEETER